MLIMPLYGQYPQVKQKLLPKVRALLQGLSACPIGQVSFLYLFLHPVGHPWTHFQHGLLSQVFPSPSRT